MDPQHNTSTALAKWGLGLSLLGLFTCIPAVFGCALGLLALWQSRGDERRPLRVPIAAILIGLWGMVFFTTLAVVRFQPRVMSGGLASAFSVPRAVDKVLVDLQVLQERIYKERGGWATSFADLEYQPPEGFGYAICIPADCLQPARETIPVPVVLSAHLAVGDCIAAVVGKNQPAEVWILYRDGVVRSDGPCMQAE